MAKHFSEKEQVLIKRNLLGVGKELFEKYGIKATSVDKIVERVGIAKGSFYNFYNSKESLIYNIILEIEQKMHIEEMNNLNAFLTEMEFTKALNLTIRKSLNYLKEEPLLMIINDPQLICTILSKITESERNRGDYQNQIRILDFIEVGEKQGYSLTIKKSAFNSILLSFFTMYVNQNMIGEDSEEALNVIMKATLDTIFLKDN